MSLARHLSSALVLVPCATLLVPLPAAAEGRDGAEIIHGVVFIAIVGGLFLMMLGFGLWLLWAGLRARRDGAGPPDLRPALERLYAPGTGVVRR